MTKRKVTKRSIKKKRSGKRKLPGLYGGNDRLDEKFLNILDSADPNLKVYIYRAKDDRRDGPSIYECHPFPTLQDFLRDEFGGGEYAIMIRQRSGPFVFSAVVSIGVPLNWRALK